MSDFIKYIIQNEISLIEILSSQSINQLIKSNDENFLLYLIKTNILKNLLEFSLSHKYKNEKYFLYFNRISTTILSTVIPFFQTNIFFCFDLIEFLLNFMNSNNISESLLSGNFKKIIESITRLTNGKFLNFLPEIRNFLINNIINLSYRELFIFFSTEFTDLFLFSTNLIKNSLNNLQNNYYSYFLITSYKLILKQKPKLIIYFNDQEFFNILFNFGIKEEIFPYISQEIFYLLFLIYNLFPNLLIPKNLIKFNKINCSTPFLLSILPEYLNLFVNHLFDLKFNSFLVNSINELITNLSEIDLINLIENQQICDKIIQNFGKNKTSGHLTHLSLFIMTKNLQCSQTLKYNWKNFIENILKPHLKIRDSIINLNNYNNNNFCLIDDFINSEFVINSNLSESSSEEYSESYSYSEDYDYE